MSEALQSRSSNSSSSSRGAAAYNMYGSGNHVRATTTSIGGGTAIRVDDGNQGIKQQMMDDGVSRGWEQPPTLQIDDNLKSVAAKEEESTNSLRLFQVVSHSHLLSVILCENIYIHENFIVLWTRRKKILGIGGVSRWVLGFRILS